MRSDNTTVDGELDVGWTGYFDADKHSEAVSGTSDDDLGEVRTELLPSEIDTDELTDKQRKILKAYYADRSRSQRQIAEISDSSDTHAARVLHNFAPDYTPNRTSLTTVVCFDDLSDNVKLAIDKLIQNPDKSNPALSRELGMSESYVYGLKSRYPEIIEERREQLANDIEDNPAETEESTETTDGDLTGDWPTPDPVELSEAPEESEETTVIHEHRHTVRHEHNDLVGILGLVTAFVILSELAERLSDVARR